MSNKEEIVVEETLPTVIEEIPYVGYNPTPEERVAYITCVKKRGNGYFVNGEMGVPSVDGNKEYEDIKIWLSLGNTPDDEFTSNEIEQARIATIKQTAGIIINSRYPIYKQQNVALGLETKEYGDTMIKFIKNNKGTLWSVNQLLKVFILMIKKEVAFF